MRRAPWLFPRGCGPVLTSKRVYQGVGSQPRPQEAEIPKPTRTPAGVRPGLTTLRVGAAQRAQSRGDVARGPGEARRALRRPVRKRLSGPSNGVLPGKVQSIVLKLWELFTKFASSRACCKWLPFRAQGTVHTSPRRRGLLGSQSPSQSHS